MVEAAARPVETLREHLTALQAALVVCLGDARPKAVHKLRTETRRVEAQLVLLGELGGLPRFGREAKRVRRHLKKVRRAAGWVRDLDVQQKLLGAEGVRRESGRDARTMAEVRKRRREQAAGKLREQLEKRQGKLARGLEALLEALQPAADLELGVRELLAMVERRFRKRRELEVEEPTGEQLHALRKSAKVARYLAESAPGSRRARQTAKLYERLQEAGGEWHDWMELAREAEGELGFGHALAADFAGRCGRHLGKFRELLRGFRGAGGTVVDEGAEQAAR